MKQGLRPGESQVLRFALHYCSSLAGLSVARVVVCCPRGPVKKVGSLVCVHVGPLSRFDPYGVYCLLGGTSPSQIDWPRRMELESRQLIYGI